MIIKLSFPTKMTVDHAEDFKAFISHSSLISYLEAI